MIVDLACIVALVSLWGLFGHSKPWIISRLAALDDKLHRAVTLQLNLDWAAQNCELVFYLCGCTTLLCHTHLKACRVLVYLRIAYTSQWRPSKLLYSKLIPIHTRISHLVHHLPKICEVLLSSKLLLLNRQNLLHCGRHSEVLHAPMSCRRSHCIQRHCIVVLPCKYLCMSAST